MLFSSSSIKSTSLSEVFSARLLLVPIIALCLFNAAPAQNLVQSSPPLQTSMQELATRLQVGDVVFIRVPALPFKKVASATNSWTNHVGIVIDVSGKEPLIGESRLPFSGSTPFSRFVARSEAGRVEVSRLNIGLTLKQKDVIKSAAQKKSGIFYDTGFDLHSNRQFCSRYVREILYEATGTSVGETETFSTLLTSNPKTDLTFWHIWYFGKIPWQRETVTPASLLRSSKLHSEFDGIVKTAQTS